MFVRGKRKLTLTEEGHFLCNRAREILELMDRTESAFNREGEILSGDVSIACGETVFMDVIAELFRQFHEKYPDVRLHLHSGDAEMALERLDKGLADMALLLRFPEQEKYDSYDLAAKDTFGLLMSSEDPLARQENIRAEQLSDLPLILSEQTWNGREDLNRLGLDRASLRVIATYNLISNATYLAERGIGYVLCLDGLVNTHGRKLAFRPIIPELSLNICLVMKKFQTLSPAAKAFSERILEDRHVPRGQH